MTEIDLDTAIGQIARATRKRTSQDPAGFPFFLIVGAGISHPSIPLAAGIERLCRDEILKEGLGAQPQESGSALDRYERCFDQAFPQAEDRQAFLHALITRLRSPPPTCGLPIFSANGTRTDISVSPISSSHRTLMRC